MQYFAEAPSNIALIKYMGKQDHENNTPLNASLSYTVDELKSYVTIESYSGAKDAWEPLDMPGVSGFHLSEHAKLRFLEHLARVKAHFSFEGSLLVRSCNNFPIATGLASSASSFAALTIAACRALSELTNTEMPDTDTMANMSRLGSGSSCRSFYKPWALWDDESIKAIELPYNELIHHSYLASHDEKTVSSREAHKRVATSPHYNGRADRAHERLATLLQQFRADNWQGAFQTVWDEFQDMHDLFRTASEPFNYITDNTQVLLDIWLDYWEKHGDGPLVTMDAGPNVHLFFRPDQADEALRMKQNLLKDYDVI